ncbi:D-Ala-D-Ala carboxypeptidase family metallohydrolase [Robiginitomaculum antarcticum]|uniref:D-Ala-D-Ala carboxypeptidase family metallohydrolase n=1 Tax=Robiginitomaculum antarcticum TaxID=437507 RepID=UPI00036ADC39|nr:D-Ala-D-Ala carboxypeptidase family metallohydrolase [Robiginitomaculum antarcticum]
MIKPKSPVFAITALVAVISCSLSAPALAESPQNREFKLAGKVVEYSVWHKMVMPGQVLPISLRKGQSANVDGDTVTDGWTAPKAAGTHYLTVTGRGGKVVSKVTLFVLEPSSNIDDRGYLGTYRIGQYPKDTPRGFIKLNKEDGNIAVSPSFKVGQFLCKQQPKVWPKYVLVSEPNLDRLETLLNDLNAKGLTDAKTLFVMSGYRTPFYNYAIGSAKMSRHMYGDAADVYIDTKPRDGVMDDINGDGAVTKADANFLYDHAQTLFGIANVNKGGLGSYKANAVHGPFVHVDGRGRPARWGR